MPSNAYPMSRRDVVFASVASQKLHIDAISHKARTGSSTAYVPTPYTSSEVRKITLAMRATRRWLNNRIPSQ